MNNNVFLHLYQFCKLLMVLKQLYMREMDSNLLIFFWKKVLIHFKVSTHTLSFSSCFKHLSLDCQRDPDGSVRPNSTLQYPSDSAHSSCHNVTINIWTILMNHKLHTGNFLFFSCSLAMYWCLSGCSASCIIRNTVDISCVTDSLPWLLRPLKDCKSSKSFQL